MIFCHACAASLYRACPIQKNSQLIVTSPTLRTHRNGVAKRLFRIRGPPQRVVSVTEAQVGIYVFLVQGNRALKTLKRHPHKRPF